MAGLNAVGVDFDRQASFYQWAERRLETLGEGSDLVAAPVHQARLQDWRDGVALHDRYDLTIIDTPPSVEDHMSAISRLAALADIIVVPAQCSIYDVKSISPWVEVLAKQRRRVIVVLNRANRRTSSFAVMRGEMIKVADVCPIEIPQLEDLHVPAIGGLTTFDMGKSRAAAPMREVWQHIQRSMDYT